jgi:NTP pyrophosphatase (non-canonical NTP hydrolase)
MEFNKYQEFTKSLAAYNEAAFVAVADETGSNSDCIDMPYLYPAMAVAEEAGEVAGKIAKFVRKSRQFQPADVESAVTALKADIGKELGDVLYQVSETARQFGYTLQDIVDMNIAKLTDRQERGVLVGEGDNR